MRSSFHFAALFTAASAALALAAWSQFPRRAPRPAGPPPPWMNAALSPGRRADLIEAQMTLAEKLQLVHGGPRPIRESQLGQIATASREQLAQWLIASRSNGGAGFIPGVPRLGIPDIQMADSAVGVTRGAARGRYSTLLPSTAALAASWDPSAARAYGALIGRELRDQGYDMSLGGGLDLAREPRNGRNFEYLGEDPILAGTMDGQLVSGLQSQHVMGDVKHYAFNDQETGRTHANAVVPDHRVMRETDLLGFQLAVQQGHPAAVMCAYNLVNGVYSCENSYLLHDVLKGAFGFQGFVVSDWGATHSTVKAALAGLDIEMPGDRFFGGPLAQAVGNGTVPMARLNDMVHRILRSEFAAGLLDHPVREQVPNVFAGLTTARHLADQTTVLLRNRNRQLPLSPSVASIAVIGGHADVGVLSGGGSAQVMPPGGNAVTPAPGHRVDGEYFPDSPLRAIQAEAPRAQVVFNDGSDPAAAAALARSSSVAIVFCTQPMSEGRDARTLELPGRQNALVSAVAAANPHTVVVLETGGPVAMPWNDAVGGILEAWFPGTQGAESIADILFGRVNPSAKTPFTFPRSDAQLPHPEIAGMPAAGVRGPNTQFDVSYSEGLKVGYKWFEAENKTPLYPFGFGLSYSRFTYRDLHTAPDDAGGISVSFDVKDVAARAGTEIAEIYLSFPAGAGEPPQRLIGWERMTLAPGESRHVSVDVPQLYLSVFDDASNAWRVFPGQYSVRVGSSSRDLPLRTTLALPAPPQLPGAH